MKTAGIVGGIGPDSTIEYYRSIIRAYRDTINDGSYPRLLINSIDMKKMLDLVSRNRLDELAEFLADQIAALERAGADFAALAANTPHIVFPELERRSRIPLVSIVEAACAAARERGYRRVALFGTRFTMQAHFYPQVFEPAGISIVLPSHDEQTLIHDIYAGELLNGSFREESALRMRAIAGRLKAQERIDCVALAGTELPLLLREREYDGIPMLDTTKEHVQRIVRFLIP
jgi:aspartate racemase